MIILAIETSTRIVGIALWQEGAPLADSVIQGPRELAARLAPAIQSLVADAGIGIDALGGIAVDHGPGSFTGLRVGLTTAKMLAHAGGLPVVGVSSLEAAAHSTRSGQAWRCRDRSGLIICPVLHSHRDQLYAGGYRSAGDRLEMVLAEGATDGPALVAELNAIGEPVLFCGEAAELPREWLAGLSVAADYAAAADSLPSAVAVAELGARRLARGEDDSALALGAQYLRKSSAEVDHGEAAEATR